MPTCTFCDAEVSVGATRCPSCGAEQPKREVKDASRTLDADLRSYIERGDKIGAIKCYREATGVGLAEAKHAVEAFERGAVLDVNSPGPADSDLDGDILNVLSRDGKIAAIKFYRERTKVGLKEAKEAVEGIATRHGVAAKGSGCAGVLLLFVCALLTAIKLT